MVVNRTIDSIKKIMLLSAGIHVIILFFLAIIKNDLWIINYFNILDLEVLFPVLKSGFWINVISFEIVILLFVIMYFFCYDKKKRY